MSAQKPKTTPVTQDANANSTQLLARAQADRQQQKARESGNSNRC